MEQPSDSYCFLMEKNRKMGDENALQPLYFFFPPFFFFPLAALATILTSKL
jgi:hypothetical protein